MANEAPPRDAAWFRSVGATAWQSAGGLPWFSIIVLSVMLVVTIAAPLVAPHDPEAIDLGSRLRPPAWLADGDSAYFLGTDALGRDLLSRILHGGQVSVAVAGIVLVTGGVIGLALGIVAGYLGGWVSLVIMRLVDTLLALPLLLLAIVFAMTFEASLQTVVIAISLVIWARFARVIRGEVLAVSTSAYVLQARVAGVSPVRIMLVHILPNILNTWIVLLSLNIGWVILVEAALSFLGAGIPPPTPSWGSMISDGRQYMTTAWWISLFPGLALALFVLAVNLLGDWLRDKLDPRLRQL